MVVERARSRHRAAKDGPLPALGRGENAVVLSTQRRADDPPVTLPPVLPSSQQQQPTTPAPRRPLPYLGALRDLLPQPTSTQQELQRQQRAQLLAEWARQIEEKRIAEAQRRAQEALRDAQEDAAVAAYHAQHTAQRTPRHDTAPPLSAPVQQVPPQPATLSQLQAQWALVQEAQQQLAAAGVGRRVTDTLGSTGTEQRMEQTTSTVGELHSDSCFLSRKSNRIPRLVKASDAPSTTHTRTVKPRKQAPSAGPPRRWR